MKTKKIKTVTILIPEGKIIPGPCRPIKSSKAQVISLLTQAGELLYGPRWKTDLGRALGYSGGRRVRQWLSGERPLPSDLPRTLGVLLAEREAQIHKLLDDCGVSSEDSLLP